MITMLKIVAANPRDVPAAVDEILRLEKRIAKVYVAIGGFHSRLIDRETLGGQVYAYCRFMLCGSEQIFIKLHVFAIKHDLNTYNKHSTRSDNCVSVKSSTPRAKCIT